MPYLILKLQKKIEIYHATTPCVIGCAAAAFRSTTDPVPMRPQQFFH